MALIEAVAILGDGTTLSTAARLAGLSEPGTALDQAVEADILTTISPDRVTFVHPLTRSAVFHTMTQSRRVELHRTASDLLEVTDSASASIDPDLAAEVAEQTERDAATRSWLTAANRYRIAARLAEPGSALSERAMLGMIDCLALESDTSLFETMESTIRAFESSALRSYTLGRLRGLSGAWTDAKEFFSEAWRDVDESTQSELASRICGEAARVEIVGGRGSAALEWLEKANAFAPTDSVLQHDLMTMWALALGIQGRADEALAALAGFTDSEDDPKTDDLDQLTGAKADLSTVVKATRSHGPVHVNLYASQYLADAAYRTGSWDVAIVTAEDAIAVARDSGNRWALPMLHAVASYPHSNP